MVMNQQEYRSQKIKCDCCGNETLAEIRDDKIIIIDKRHGRRHIAILKISDLLAIMQKAAVDHV
jgi:hypothetical protein